MSQLVDITGQRFGRFTVLRRVGSDQRNNACYECRCECGAIVVRVGSYLRYGKIKSCGCLYRDSRRRAMRRRLEAAEANGVNKLRNARAWKKRRQTKAVHSMLERIGL